MAVRTISSKFHELRLNMMSRLVYLVLALGLLQLATADSSESAETTEAVGGNKPSDDFILQAFEHSVYNKHAMPDTSEGPVMVRFHPHIDRVVGLDVDKQILTAHLYLEMTWKDSRIKKFFDEFGVDHKLVTSIKQLWTPDIWLYNSADSSEGEYGDVQAILYPDGTVFWVPSLALRSYCQVDYDVMEGDKVNCTMKFGSWVYSSKEVDFKVVEAVGLADFEHSREWHLVQSHLLRFDTKYDCCPDTYVTKDLVMELERTAFVKN